MKKWSIEKMSDFWSLWEQYAGESFIDYFVDDNIHNMGIVIEYFCDKYLPSISELVEEFYEVENEDGVYNDENYDKVIYAWCSLIHDVDVYYSRFSEWINKNETPDVIEKLNKKWSNETESDNC